MEQDKSKEMLPGTNEVTEPQDDGAHRHHGHRHRSHHHHHRGERERLEELLIVPGESTSQEEKRRSHTHHHHPHSSHTETPEQPEKEPSATTWDWRKIALLVSAAVCLATILVAACVWLIGRPLAFGQVGTYFRLAKFGGTTMAALGAMTLFNSIATLRWKVLSRSVLAVFGAFLLMLGAILLSWKWWLPELVVKPVVEDNVQQEEEPHESEVEVTPNLPSTDHVRNIALFGIDQERGSVGRSDALMILSIDKTNNKIKLTSLDRDSLVAIDGHGEEKLTHAWAYGHGKLAVKTLNQNFGMNITDYAYVNFTEFITAIDYLGGVTVDITAAELDYTNGCWIDWVNEYGDWETPKIAGTGRQTLNGAQALSYSRNRSDGTGRRAARQREVLMAMADRVKKQAVGQWPATVGRMLQLCHTTLSSDEIWELALWVLEEAPTIEELSLPTPELKAWGGVIDRQRGWVRVYDLEAATVVLHNFVYETDKALPNSSEEDTASTSAPADDPNKKTEQTKNATKK